MTLIIFRNTYNNKRKNSGKKKGQKRDKNRKDKTGSRSSNSTYIDKSKLITIDSLTKGTHFILLQSDYTIINIQIIHVDIVIEN